ncbi:MAG: hypothetical protein V7L23_18605 [Nostoc sp.]|uniref:hypothetical protein n=1 Tax=Nostoc sp. TaxID=1180 RepID=UPI002FF3C18E
MTQTITATKSSIEVFNEAIANFTKMTKAEILAEGQALGCKLIPYYSLKKVIAWTVTLRYMFVNEKTAYDDIIANYNINTHECTATPKNGYMPGTLGASDWVGDISEALTELKSVAVSEYGNSAQHAAYIADNTAKMKEIICYHDKEARRNEIGDPEARAIIAETLIANGIGQAITPPYNDYHYWLQELQSIIPLVASNGTLASKKLSAYRRHGGTVTDKMGALSRQEILTVLLQEINAIAGYLESFSSDRDAGLPIYTKRDNIAAIANFVVGDLFIKSPVNTKVSSNDTLILHSSYQCKLSVKRSILAALKVKHDDVDQVVVPMIVRYQKSGHNTLAWDANIFDIEIIGEKFAVVDEIFSIENKQVNWYKKSFMLKRLMTTSTTHIKAKSVSDDEYCERYSIPGTLRVSKEDRCFIRCEGFPEWQSSRSVEVSRNGGETWHSVFTLLGYEVQQMKGKEVRHHSLGYESRE